MHGDHAAGEADEALGHAVLHHTVRMGENAVRVFHRPRSDRRIRRDARAQSVVPCSISVGGDFLGIRAAVGGVAGEGLSLCHHVADFHRCARVHVRGSAEGVEAEDAAGAAIHQVTVGYYDLQDRVQPRR